MSKLLGKRLFVKEVKKDIIVDGFLQKYDDCSDFIFAKVLDVGEELENNPIFQNKDNLIIALGRIAKHVYIDGYIVNYDDVIYIYDEKEFDELFSNIQ